MKVRLYNNKNNGSMLLFHTFIPIYNYQLMKLEKRDYNTIIHVYINKSQWRLLSKLMVSFRQPRLTYEHLYFIVHRPHVKAKM